ncbi:MAG TPA: PIN domain-containing protein [Puia sp.]|nr:PIN domain-containing protein [Puia sp.]
MGYLLDTNICIYIIKRKPESVLQRLRALPLGEIGLSSLTVAELDYGARKSANPEKNLLEKQGLPIGPLDTLIAAHAKSLRYTLVTNNEREFRRVENLEVENWVE